MSATETDQNLDELELGDPPAEALEREHTRSFEVDLETVGDGRTVEMRIVPYDTPAIVRDGRGPVYREQFARGAFERQLAVRERHGAVLLNFEHDQSIRGVIGNAAELVDTDAGPVAHFRMHENADGDKALQLVNAGVLRGASIEFAALKSKVVGGIVTRVRAHVDAVALCRNPAYMGAGVLAVREDELDDDELERHESLDELRVAPLGDGLRERLEALGVDLLVRAFVDEAWNGSPSRWPDAESYCRSCLIDDNPAGEPKVKELCHLPITAPGSDVVNVNAVAAALGRVNQVQTSQGKRATARARLESLRAQIQARR